MLWQSPHPGIPYRTHSERHCGRVVLSRLALVHKEFRLFQEWSLFMSPVFLSGDLLHAGHLPDSDFGKSLLDFGHRPVLLLSNDKPFYNYFSLNSIKSIQNDRASCIFIDELPTIGLCIAAFFLFIPESHITHFYPSYL